MNNNGHKLTNKQIIAIPHLLSDPVIDRACRKANISRVTFYKWMEDITFRDEYEKRRGEIIDDAVKKLKTCFSNAVDELCRLLASENENIRLRTAEKIIEYHLEISSIEKIEERISIIENKTLSR